VLQASQGRQALTIWLNALHASACVVVDPAAREQLLAPLVAAQQSAEQPDQRSDSNPSSQQLRSEAASAAEQVLSAADVVAAQIAQAWEASDEAAKQRLRLAQAAATRSCAYLACSNLAVDGGPAAGQGVGSLRCSGCKVAWYCGTPCSHADWRAGGHRRRCKALAAASAEQAAT
jgi:hypothetical protein